MTIHSLDYRAVIFIIMVIVLVIIFVYHLSTYVLGITTKGLESFYGKIAYKAVILF